MSRKTLFTLNGWGCLLSSLSFSLLGWAGPEWSGPLVEAPPVLSSYPSFVRELSGYLKPWSVSTQTSANCQTYLDSIPENFSEIDPHACRLELNLGYINRVKGQIFFNYDISDPKRFIKFTERLNAQVQIRGLAALHRGERRPLVLFRMGVHGNRDEVLAERFLLKLLHEDLRLHVVMLENLTAHSYLVMNEKVSFGGIEEGLHSFLLLKRIQSGKFLNTPTSLVDQAAEIKTPFAWTELVSSYHLVGLSLGGHGSFVTTWLDEQTGPTLNSTLLFCPLVNLDENFKNLAQPGFFNTFVDLWNWRRLVSIRSRIPDYGWGDFLRTVVTFTPRFTPATVAWLDQTEPKPLVKIEDIKTEFPDVRMDQKFEEHVRRAQSLIELNQFWPIFENKETKLNMITTSEDPLVDPALNADRILNGTQAGHFEKVQRVQLGGFHCALTAEYEWDYLVQLTRIGLGL